MLAKTLIPLALGALGVTASAQGVGSQIPDSIELEGLSQTGAQSFDDFMGRAVLLEFFAYW